MGTGPLPRIHPSFASVDGFASGDFAVALISVGGYVIFNVSSVISNIQVISYASTQTGCQPLLSPGSPSYPIKVSWLGITPPLLGARHSGFKTLPQIRKHPLTRTVSAAHLARILTIRGGHQISNPPIRFSSVGTCCHGLLGEAVMELCPLGWNSIDLRNAIGSSFSMAGRCLYHGLGGAS